jgi:antitoxin component of MazEF toxin-antitoxin module
MNVSTLRNWGGAVAVSLPKKLLASLGLGAGSEVEVKIKDGSLVLSPIRGQHALAQLEKEQRSLERSLGGPLVDREWSDSAPRGREQL